MKLTELKNEWANLKTPVRSATDLKLMLVENRHPILKKIRRQLTIEIVGWSFFLISYYMLFDGDSKPVGINFVLIVSVLLPLFHNLMGYRLTTNLVHGATIREFLINSLAKLKRYAAIAIACRFFFVTGICVFFCYGLSSNTKRSVSLGVMIVILVIQLWLLYRVWGKRIKNLEQTLDMFS